MQQPRDVVVGGEKHAYRVVERLVEGEPARIDVPVRADQRQISCALVEVPGDPAHRRVGRKQPVRVQGQREDAVGGGHVPIIRDARGGGNPRPTAKLARMHEMSRQPPRRSSNTTTRFLAAAGLVALLGGMAFIVIGETGDDGGTTAAPTTTKTATAPPPVKKPPPPTRIVVTGVGAYDPEGDQSENGGDARLATDGNATTAWKSEHYRTTFRKSGVGLVLDAGRPVKATRVVVTSETPGFAAQVQVGASPIG